MSESKNGHIVFAACDDGSEFTLPVNDDGTCGPLPKAATMIRFVAPRVSFPDLVLKVNAGLITREEAMRGIE